MTMFSLPIYILSFVQLFDLATSAPGQSILNDTDPVYLFSTLNISEYTFKMNTVVCFESILFLRNLKRSEFWGMLAQRTHEMKLIRTYQSVPRVQGNSTNSLIYMLFLGILVSFNSGVL